MAETGQEREQPMLVFRGRPDDLEALAPFAVDPRGGLPKLRPSIASGGPEETRAALAAADHPHLLQFERAGERATWLRLSLPNNTSAGTYPVAVSVGDTTYDAVVVVEPLYELAISPSHLAAEVVPGGHTEARVTMLNTGNVDCELGRAQTFGIFEVGGAEASLARAYRDPDVHGQERVGRLADELAKRHGLVRVRIKDGDQVIAPGQMVALSVDFRWPDRLRPGLAYSGLWRIYNLRWSVQARVQGGKRAGKSTEDEE